MEQKFGTKTIKKAIAVGIDISHSIVKALKDKKFTFFETVGVASKAFPIAEIIREREAFLNELSELSEDEKKELKDWVKQEYDIPDDRVEQTIEKSITALLNITDLGFELEAIWREKE